MSLLIDVDHVTAVLLADGWHTVLDQSFELDAYEYVRGMEMKDTLWPTGVRLGGGAEPLVPATGAVWEEETGRICCPITAILAVRVNRPSGSTSR